MHIMSFSEREYIDVPEEAIIENEQSYFGLPNTLFEANRGGELMNEYLDERVYAEELGFDGVMLNEHHQTPFCGGAVMDVEASIPRPYHQAGENRAARQSPAGWGSAPLS